MRVRTVVGGGGGILILLLLVLAGVIAEEEPLWTLALLLPLRLRLPLKDAKEAKMEPPIHAEYFRSGGAAVLCTGV